MSITLPRILRTLACAAVMLPAAAQAADFVSITGNTVNVRKQPNTRSEVAWELSKGYPLQIEQRQGQWLKVRDFEESLGWVFSPLTGKTPHRVVTPASPTCAPTPARGTRWWASWISTRWCARWASRTTGRKYGAKAASAAGWPSGLPGGGEARPANRQLAEGKSAWPQSQLEQKVRHRQRQAGHHMSATPTELVTVQSSHGGTADNWAQ